MFFAATPTGNKTDAPAVSNAFYLGLGANLGPRWTTLAHAIRHLDALPDTRVAAVSSAYASKPIGVTDQPDFLNLVLSLETNLDAPTLLAHCLAIETTLGRIRRERWGPRTIDIDLLHSPTHLISNDTLTLPHPRLWERSFVLVPLAEIAPELVIENRSVAEAAQNLAATDLRPVAQLDWANPSECRSLLAGESDTSNLRHPNRLQAGSYIQTSTVRLPTLRPIALSAAPETVFSAVSDKPYAFLLDSAQPAGALGQFTFFGFNPFLVVRAHATGFTLTRPRTPDAPAETRTGDGLALLRELFAPLSLNPARRLALRRRRGWFFLLRIRPPPRARRHPPRRRTLRARIRMGLLRRPRRPQPRLR